MEIGTKGFKELGFDSKELMESYFIEMMTRRDFDAEFLKDRLIEIEKKLNLIIEKIF